MYKRFISTLLLLFLVFLVADREGKSVVALDSEIPFIAQAPTADWNDIRQQDGCEEASVLMAVKWARREKATASKAGLEKEITDLADYQKEKWGVFEDTSASTTAEWLLKGFFSFTDYRYVENISKEDIIKELEKGNLVILPVDGKKLKNPYFSNGGPDKHMLVVKAYDYGQDHFVTNDPGTKRGESYRYEGGLLYEAVRDYPTGSHRKIEGVKKNMIVILKK